MADSPRNPSLYQMNTRLLLQELGLPSRRCATFDDVSDGILDSLQFLGFDWLWMLGVWTTGEASRAVSRSHREWYEHFRQLLPDLNDDDITGSPFAIRSYSAHPDFGGDEALARFRERLHQRGIRLMLDFVPNHTALDHPWVFEHPNYYMQGDAADLARGQDFKQVDTRLGPRIIAHGKDPYFPCWPDTFQLNYRSEQLRKAMIDELMGIARRCDGVRCDMAMLLLPDVIERTWGHRSLPAAGEPRMDRSFWLEATYRLHAENADFRFVAEVYWDREWDLQQQGFDATYDKRLYNRLVERNAGSVRAHLGADLEFQRKSVRFLENHDEPRAAATFPTVAHRAAAIVAYLTPGMRLFQEGQLEGRHIQASVHLGRRPDEPIDSTLRTFYGRLLELMKNPAVRHGEWQLLDCRPAWDGNVSHSQFIAFSWQIENRERLLAAVNFGANRGQCRIALPWLDLNSKMVTLRDRINGIEYRREGRELVSKGLYLDVTDWQYHVFEVSVD